MGRKMEIFVDEEFRGRGAGKHFMYTLAEIAMALGCGHFVWRAFDWNTNTLKILKLRNNV
eukprot:4119669-Ditylum_brightwellii.AAC.1